MLEDLDALVLGAGPAAVAAGIHLRRAGATVILVDRACAPPRRPREVVTARTWRAMRALGAVDAPAGAIPCRGLLARWDGSTQFHDYALAHCEPALAVEAVALQRSLEAAAEKADIGCVRANAIEPRWIDGAWHVDTRVDGREHRFRARTLLLAAGRSFPRSLVTGHGRRHLDRHIAWSLVVRRSTTQGDCLVVEASSSGWWYAPPTTGGEDDIVFLTDSDLLPREAAARDAFVLAQLASTRSIRAALEDLPVHPRLTGCDARSSLATPCPAPHCYAIGDAVLALDPLSGRGVAFALESGRAAAACIDADTPASYAAWVLSRFDAETDDRAQTYSRARPAHAGAYWMRRRTLRAGRGADYSLQEHHQRGCR